MLPTNRSPFEAVFAQSINADLINQPPGRVDSHVDPSKLPSTLSESAAKTNGSALIVALSISCHSFSLCLRSISAANALKSILSSEFRRFPRTASLLLRLSLRRRRLYLQHALIQLNHIHKLLKLLWLPRRPHVCTAAAQIGTGRGGLAMKEFILRLLSPCVCLRGERRF